MVRGDGAVSGLYISKEFPRWDREGRGKMGRNRAHTWASRYIGRACSTLARLGETRRPPCIMPIPP